MMHEILSAIDQAQTRYYRLLLLVGAHGSTKTKLLRQLAEKRGFAYVRLSLEISKEMLGMTSPQRAAEVDRLANELVAGADGAVVLLDNTEVLFSPVLQVDPLRALQSASRISVVVAAWAGTYDGTTLSYAESGHPEHRAYRNPEAVILTAK